MVAILAPSVQGAVVPKIKAIVRPHDAEAGIRSHACFLPRGIGRKGEIQIGAACRDHGVIGRNDLINLFSKTLYYLPLGMSRLCNKKC